MAESSRGAKIRLLKVSRDRLRYIICCILQTSPKITEDYLGKVGTALTGKIAGVGASAGLLGLVTSFGTAGTGAAISGLSGAAAMSAKLAWVGSIVGGGVAAGTMLTGGLTLIVAIATIKLVSSTPRTDESLSDIDRLIINTCAILITQIDADLEAGTEYADKDLALTLENAIRPLSELILDSEEDIGSRLDKKNKAAFKMRAIPNFLDDVLVEFEKFK